MSESDFWRSTPKKIGTLWRLHAKFNQWEFDGEEENNKEQRLCIDQIPFL